MGYEEMTTPWRIQEFLDSLEYDPTPEARSPRIVLEEMRAHCFEGALLAASALRRIGHRPLLVDLRAVNDDDHVIAVFKEEGGWGAVAKSNFTTLRFREPVYTSVRELSMSYFDLYFNTKGEKTLREYSDPFDLSAFDGIDWEGTEEDLEAIGDALDSSSHHMMLAPGAEGKLNKVPGYLLEAGLIGSRADGLYDPD